MGRPAAPTALKLIRGGHPERINDDEPIPAQLEVRPPTWLKGDARKLWDQYAPDLVDKGVLKFWDVPTFAWACRQYVAGLRSLDKVDSEGPTIKGQRGSVKNPAATHAKECFDQAFKVFTRFGMTPSDRSQLRVGEHKKYDDADRYLS